jgi:hypothetical protein
MVFLLKKAKVNSQHQCYEQEKRGKKNDLVEVGHFCSESGLLILAINDK